MFFSSHDNTDNDNICCSSHNITDIEDIHCENNPPIRLNPDNTVNVKIETDTIILTCQDVTTDNENSENDNIIYLLNQSSSNFYLGIRSNLQCDTVNYSLFPNKSDIDNSEF